MMGQPTKRENSTVFRRLAPAIGLFVGLAPAMTHAQTNIDQGKTPAEIFASDCATCHKTARGLASGKSSPILTGFLREHYTASSDQAAALAAYVMGAGGGDSVPATQGRGLKPVPEHARAAVEEPKSASHPTRQTGKPEEGTPAAAKLQQPAGEETKRPGNGPSITQEPGVGTPGHRPTSGQHDLQPATATRGRRKEPESTPPAQEPAAVVAEPSSTGLPVQDASPATAPGPNAAAPANADSGENAPVPRDNISD
jgi:hypothetical protein